MMIAGPLLAALTLALPALAQDGRLRRSDAAKAYAEVADLMQASSFAIPTLARAGAPLIENVRQAAKDLSFGPTREHAALQYRLLTNARLFLQLSDAVPKPYPFGEEGRGMLQDLRVAVDRVDAHYRASLNSKEELILGSDRDNLARYREANRQLAAPERGDKRVVFFGDSITDAWRLNQFFPGKAYVNRGISGQITGQMLGRMNDDVIALQPAAMLVLAGTNDLARRVPLTTIQSNLEMIAALAVAAGIRPIFASILPVSDHHKATDPNFERTPFRRPEDIRAMNEWLQDFCRDQKFVYLDYYSATVDDDGFFQAQLGPDGLHPNQEGYKVMAPLAEKAIAKALADPTPKPTRKKRRFGLF